MGFKTPLQVEFKCEGEDRCVWQLLGDLVYEGQGITVTVPKGFYTDFASIPRTRLAPQIYSEFGGKFNCEAVVHDYLYRIDSIPNCSQEVADDFLRYMLTDSGRYSWAFVEAVWLAVHEGGSSSFHKKRVSDTLTINDVGGE